MPRGWIFLSFQFSKIAGQKKKKRKKENAEEKRNSAEVCEIMLIDSTETPIFWQL